MITAMDGPAHLFNKNRPRRELLFNTMASMADSVGARTPNGEAALVSVPSLREGSLAKDFVTNTLSAAKSGATFHNAALDAVSEPDDKDFWTDPHSATKDLSHPTEDSLDDDDKEEEERAAGSSLQITLNGHDGTCENTKTPHFFETQADDIESKEIECTSFQRSHSCPDNESLDVVPIKRSHSYPSTFESMVLEQEQGKTRQASHLGPTHSDEVIIIKTRLSSSYGKFL